MFGVGSSVREEKSDEIVDTLGVFKLFFNKTGNTFCGNRFFTGNWIKLSAIPVDS